ncbi:hypothetical protein Misp06_03681 [Microbulbifer sp. NBRC 101763]
MGGSLPVMDLYPTTMSSSSSFELSVMAVRYLKFIRLETYRQASLAF